MNPLATLLASTNPIVPKMNEVVWGSISFLVLLVLLVKFGFPAVKKTMDARAERIRKSLEEADQTRDEARRILDEYRRQLADARGEAARIIDEARQAAEKLRQDLKRQAETEVADLRQRAQDDIRAEFDRAMSRLRSQAGQLSIELAEKVVERNLDRETNMALVDRFIEQVGSNSK